MSAGPHPDRAWFVVPADRGHPVRDMRGRAGKLAAHWARQRTAHRPGPAVGAIAHDPDSGTCRIQVGPARGPLRPVLRMRLEVGHWSSSPPRTALDLIPCGHVRPSTAYFRAGLIPITVPELLRLLRDTVIPPPRRDKAHRLRWSTWRRRHQHRARQAHQRWNAYAETTP
jgi:hypothetical protein